MLILSTARPHASARAASPKDDTRPIVRSLFEKYCHECHSGDEPSGDVEILALLDDGDAERHFEVWRKAAELLKERQMPPDGELQPTDAEREQIQSWYRTRFVESVVARPGEFRPRRLCASEYRRTLRSLLGFDLEIAVMEAEQTVVEKSLVLKLLPTDPPGDSGFRNDTHSNPLTTAVWGHYSYVADAALDELFSPHRRSELAALSGDVSEDGYSIADAEALIRSFVPRAYRRAVPDAALEKIVSAVRESDDLVAATKRELKIVLMSPAFLYRGLLMESVPGRQQPVDDYELAERLSYFIWGDMPDAELTTLASQRRLSDPDVLRDQVDRLLASPKAFHLADDFAVQWLALDEIDHVSNNPPFAAALKSQPVDFMNYLLTGHGPLLELVDSETAFVNPLTKKFYPSAREQFRAYKKPKGIEIEAVPNQQVRLDHSERHGGLLTMPGVLAMNRGPVLRGTWMLERILGEHLPDPPADVGVVPPNAGGQNLSFRERFELHRANASCAVCHDKIDPLGFALQQFDSDGNLRGEQTTRRRKKADPYAGGEIDTSGRLPSGESFDDFGQLKLILTTSQRERVIRNLVERTLSFALCRKLEIYDQPTVQQIVGRLTNGESTYRDLMHEIVSSLPFRETVVPGESS